MTERTTQRINEPKKPTFHFGLVVNLFFETTQTLPFDA